MYQEKKLIKYLEKLNLW